MENMPTPESALEMIVWYCPQPACRNACLCRILVGLECIGLYKCSGSCNNETEKNDIESETDDESDDNSEASDPDSEEKDW